MDQLKIVAIAHDAGGAEVLAAMISAHRDEQRWTVVAPVASPAYQVFARHDFTTQSQDNAFDLFRVTSPDLLIAATSTTNYEQVYLNAARARQITTVSVLDHWVNYRERFGYPDSNWRKNLPDYIAVTDSFADYLANQFNLCPLVRLRNYFLSDLTRLGDSDTDDSTDLLYISESIEEHYGADKTAAGHPGFTQTQVLLDILQSWDTLSERLRVDRLVIRMHPAEAPDKYVDLLARFDNPAVQIELAHQRSLKARVASSRFVLGVSSMALLIAHMLGKPVVSYIPTGQRCDLPLPDVCCLCNLDMVEPDLAKYGVTQNMPLDLFLDYDLGVLLETVTGMAVR